MGLTESIAAFGSHVIGSIGYVGVFLLMTAESMILPVPSEAVMPFAGFVIAEGTLGWAGVITGATLGSICGSLVGYVIGKFGGRPFLSRFGKFVLLDQSDLAATDRFFQRRGSLTILVSRFIPIVRHLISIPAGMASMNLLPFVVFTVLGAGLWNTFLAWCGFQLQKNWGTVLRYSHWIDIGVVVLLVALLAWYVGRHLARRRRKSRGQG
ncbi:MAG TPA: DedA family protein [Spirochaetia bacterium]|nr:DedA family protein [Spirochaetia bacterium]